MFYHLDALGSVVATVNGSQQLSSDQRFDAFGNKGWYIPFGSTFGFAAKAQYRTDAESGLMLLGHRYYDPTVGRFISQDPAQDESNWYAYCGNNPLVAIDPEGTTPKMNSSGQWEEYGGVIVYDEGMGTWVTTDKYQGSPKQWDAAAGKWVDTNSQASGSLLTSSTLVAAGGTASQEPAAITAASSVKTLLAVSGPMAVAGATTTAANAAEYISSPTGSRTSGVTKGINAIAAGAGTTFIGIVAGGGATTAGAGIIAAGCIAAGPVAIVFGIGAIVVALQRQ